MIQKIKKALSRFFHTRIGFIIIAMTIMSSIVYVASEMEKAYDTTLGIQYLFVDTIVCMLLENYMILACAFGIFLFLYGYVSKKMKDKLHWKRRTSKLFIAGYLLIVLVILLLKPLHRNTCYVIGDNSLNTAEVLYYHAKDMIEQKYVTFQAENCEFQEASFTYTLLGGRRVEHVEETYSYLCLYDRRDVIPIDYAHHQIVQELVRQSGGKCDITCYKNSHIITAINGIELTSLK
uniref:hypothetical protein n=1 Tax=Acetatifactor sp. TaxID=1872090 RepID=UPI0040565361